MKIAQSAVQGIGMSTKEIRGTWMNNPNYALAVSLLFTRATNQRIMLGTEPDPLTPRRRSVCLPSTARRAQKQIPSSKIPGSVVTQAVGETANGEIVRADGAFDLADELDVWDRGPRLGGPGCFHLFHGTAVRQIGSAVQDEVGMFAFGYEWFE
jgi:hypothetical protein